MTNRYASYTRFEKSQWYGATKSENAGVENAEVVLFGAMFSTPAFSGPQWYFGLDKTTISLLKE